jgi:hypothetical protein
MGLDKIYISRKIKTQRQKKRTEQVRVPHQRKRRTESWGGCAIQCQLRVGGEWLASGRGLLEWRRRGRRGRIQLRRRRRAVLVVRESSASWIRTSRTSSVVLFPGPISVYAAHYYVGLAQVASTSVRNQPNCVRAWDFLLFPFF